MAWSPYKVICVSVDLDVFFLFQRFDGVVEMIEQIVSC